VRSEIKPHIEKGFMCDVSTEEKRAEKYRNTPRESPRKQNDAFPKNTQKQSKGNQKTENKKKFSSQKIQMEHHIPKTPEKTRDEIFSLTWKNSPSESAPLSIVIDRNPTGSKNLHPIVVLNPGRNLPKPSEIKAAKKIKPRRKTNYRFAIPMSILDKLSPQKPRHKSRTSKKDLTHPPEDPAKPPKRAKSPKLTKKRKRSQAEEFDTQKPTKKPRTANNKY